MGLCRSRMGAIIAALHWNEESSDADNQALAAGFPSALLKSSFAGPAVNAQFMVKLRAEAGDVLTSRRANLAMRRCTKSASPATNLQKIATTFSLATPLRPELSDDRWRHHRRASRAAI
jgi:hypothetical protein